MDHDWELFTPILEIFEIEVCNILYNPGNIGKLIFSTQSYPGNSGSYDPYINPILEILEISVWIRDMSGSSRMCLQPCFAVEPPRRGFLFHQRQHFSNFWKCPISGNSTFPWFWSLFGSIWALLRLIEPYWALLSLIGSLLTLIGALLEPYWALLSLIEPLTVKQ